jgi:hypothetical protein
MDIMEAKKKQPSGTAPVIQQEIPTTNSPTPTTAYPQTQYESKNN